MKALRDIPAGMRMCVCVCERERESVCVCVCERERVARVTKMDYSKIHGSEPSGF